MAFRKEIRKDPPPTVREMVTKYGDDWHLYCAAHPISSAVWRGERHTGDSMDAFVMRRCEKGERDRVDDWELRYATEEGRPIQVDFDSTPQLFVAIFKDEYDGAPDSHSPIGLGKTKAEAIADLLDKDQD